MRSALRGRTNEQKESSQIDVEEGEAVDMTFDETRAFLNLMEDSRRKKNRPQAIYGDGFFGLLTIFYSVFYCSSCNTSAIGSSFQSSCLYLRLLYCTNGTISVEAILIYVECMLASRHTYMYVSIVRMYVCSKIIVVSDAEPGGGWNRL